MEKYKSAQLSSVQSFVNRIPKEYSSVFIDCYLQNRIDDEALILPFDETLPKGGLVWFIGGDGNGSSVSALRYFEKQAHLNQSDLNGLIHSSFSTNSPSVHSRRAQVLHTTMLSAEDRLQQAAITPDAFGAMSEFRSVIEVEFAKWNDKLTALAANFPLSYARTPNKLRPVNKLVFVENPRKLAYLELTEVLQAGNRVIVADSADSIFKIGSREHFDFFDNEKSHMAARNILANTSAVIECKQVIVPDVGKVILHRKILFTPQQKQALLIKENSVGSVILDVLAGAPSWKDVAKSTADNLRLPLDKANALIAASARFDNTVDKFAVKLLQRKAAKSEKGLTMLNYAEQVIKLFEKEPDEVRESYSRVFPDCQVNKITSKETVRNLAQRDFTQHFKNDGFVFPDIAYELEREKSRPTLSTVVTHPNWSSEVSISEPKIKRTPKNVEVVTKVIDVDEKRAQKSERNRPVLTLKRKSIAPTNN